jgi:hypothetical protein
VLGWGILGLGFGMEHDLERVCNMGGGIVWGDGDGGVGLGGVPLREMHGGMN